MRKTYPCEENKRDEEATNGGLVWKIGNIYANIAEKCPKQIRLIRTIYANLAYKTLTFQKFFIAN